MINFMNKINQSRMDIVTKIKNLFQPKFATETSSYKPIK